MANSPLVIHLKHSPAFAAASHGWCRLAPFTFGGNHLHWAVRLPRRGACMVRIGWSHESNTVRVAIPGRRIGDEDRNFLRSRVRWMFRADESFQEFWDLCRDHAVLKHCPLQRTGALLRCATVFEDLVKTICTVNCSWANTKLMVSNLCRRFGEPCAEASEAFTFPSIERIAAASEEELKAAKVGFRARYLRELSCRIVAGELDLDAWCCESDTHALRPKILGVKGVGSYAANHLLMLLGHYDQIPCDSVVREYLGMSPKADAKVVERAAAKRYGHWGRFTFLAYKFERVFTRQNYVDIVNGKKQ